MKEMSKELLTSYTVLNSVYEAPRLMYLAGTIGAPSIAIDSPANSGLDIQKTGTPQQDPVLFSYTGPAASEKGTKLRLLLAKILTTAGTSVASYSVITPSADGASWAFLKNDINLKIGSTLVAGNPHGVAQVDDTLYIIDYDTRKIWLVGVGALDTATGSTIELTKPPIDLTANLEPDSKGQAIIYLKNGDDEYLFALYIRNDTAGTPDNPSVLVRLKKVNGVFVYEGASNQTPVGKNAQEIIPITGSGGNIRLLIPSIGGRQKSGETNFHESNICKIDPFAATLEAEIIITGDPDESKRNTTNTYDIAAIAAQAKPNGIVYILTFTFGTGYQSLNWKLYKTTADKLLAVEPGSPLSLLEITESEPDNVLQIVDHGPTASPTTYSTGLNFWDILYENGVGGTDPGRLWFRRDGIRVSMATDYENPHWWFGMGADRGQIGSENINSLELTCETLRQITASFSGKRGFKIAAPHLKANALKAARGSVPEEEK